MVGQRELAEPFLSKESSPHDSWWPTSGVRRVCLMTCSVAVVTAVSLVFTRGPGLRAGSVVAQTADAVTDNLVIPGEWSIKLCNILVPEDHGLDLFDVWVAIPELQQQLSENLPGDELNTHGTKPIIFHLNKALSSITTAFDPRKPVGFTQDKVTKIVLQRFCADPQSQGRDFPVLSVATICAGLGIQEATEKVLPKIEKEEVVLADDLQEAKEAAAATNDASKKFAWDEAAAADSNLLLQLKPIEAALKVDSQKFYDGLADANRQEMVAAEMDEILELGEAKEAFTSAAIASREIGTRS